MVFKDEAGLKLKKKNWNHICAIFEVKSLSLFFMQIYIFRDSTTSLFQQEQGSTVAFSITVNGDKTF